MHQNKKDFDFGTIYPTSVYDGNLISDKRAYNGATDIQKLNVQLGERSYPIYFDQDDSTLKATIHDLHHANQTCFLITDSKLHSLYQAYIESLGIPQSHVYIVPEGEPSKSIEQYEKILSFLASHSANRDAVIFAFGGGVIGDLAGFVAATYQRGIKYVRYSKKVSNLYLFQTHIYFQI